jgi:hypothetical protein
MDDQADVMELINLSDHIKRKETVNKVQGPSETLVDGYSLSNSVVIANPKDVTAFTQSCVECQRNNPANFKEQGFLHPLPIPSERFQEIAMDWTKIATSANRRNTAFIIVDRLTKLTVLISTSENDTTARTAELLMKHWVCRGMGVPQTITPDRDLKFGASLWNELMKILQIKHRMATARHQRTDGQAENMVKQVKTALTKLSDQGELNVEEILPYLEFALNNSVNQSTGFTPFYLAYGFHPQDFANEAIQTLQEHTYDLVQHMAENISKAKEIALATQNRQCEQWDRSHVEMDIYVPGDEVMLRSEGLLLAKFKRFPRHLVPRWLGPFRVIKATEAPNFTLQLPRTMARITLYSMVTFSKDINLAM